MRVLVVDQDSALLTAITQTLGEYFSIDTVTTKADCLDLVRVKEFAVIVAGERLEDGSGLELLGQMGRNRPDMLRIFAAERARLKLLKGRLGPFGLFRTLSYPIEPRQLLVALSAAAGIEEQGEETSEAAAAPLPPVTVHEVRRTAPTPVRVTEPVRVSTPARPTTPTPARTPARRLHTAARATGPPVRVARQSTPDALAAASRLSAVSRARGSAPLPMTAPNARRSAFLVSAGVILIVGGMVLTFRIFNASNEPAVSTTNLSTMRTPQFPPEVVELVADIETAFQKDDFKTALTDITALQQLAPDHPLLPFFQSLLARHETTGPDSAPAFSTKTLPRHVARKAPSATTTRAVENMSQSP